MSKHEPYLTELYHSVMSFYVNAHVPRNIDDVKGEWIISADEKLAFEKVLDVLVDCGANKDITEQKDEK